MTSGMPERGAISDVIPGADHSVILDAADPGARRRAAAALEQGLVVAVPTDTVYGIAARIDRPEGIARLFDLKGRSREVAIAVLVGDVEQAAAMGLVWPAARRLAEAFWPGPLTIVVDRRCAGADDGPAEEAAPPDLGRAAAPADLGDDATRAAVGGDARADILDDAARAALRDAAARADIGGDGRTVGIRVPDHPALLALLADTGPLATTSANRSGLPTPAGVEGVADVFGSGIAVYLDGGPSAGGPPSTVVREDSGHLTVLRKGPIGAEALRVVARG